MVCLASSVALLVCGAPGVYGQSIADTVKKEKTRRERTGEKARVLTEEDLRAVSPKANLSGRRAGAPAPGPEAAPRGEHVIPFAVRGNAIIVEAELNGRTPSRLILDTGASLTSLSAAAAEAAGIRVSEKSALLPMQTANGVILSPMVKLNTLRIGTVVVNDIDVILLQNWSDPDSAGLLGMNVLNQFNWHTDLTKNQLLLKPNNRSSDKETYGGYDRDWWSGRFRFLNESLEQLQTRVQQAARPEEVSAAKSALKQMETQMDTLNREATQYGVPMEWRR